MYTVRPANFVLYEDLTIFAVEDTKYALDTGATNMSSLFRTHAAVDF